MSRRPLYLQAMCGRFTHRLSWRQICELYRLTVRDESSRNTPARYNMAPTQDVLFVRLDRHGQQVVDEGRWALVPHWARELPKVPLFNARSETVAEKPAFRDAFKTHRCLIPADGYYEWTTGPDGQKDPWYIHRANDGPFSFAGLSAANDNLGITSCAIITMAASAPLAHLHDRMPVILDRRVYDQWLSPATPAQDAQALIAEDRLNDLTFYQVGRQVNSAKFDDARCIQPLGTH